MGEINMTKLLLKGIKAVQTLPPDRQDLAGEMLLSLATEPEYELSPEQIEDLELSIAEADRGEFATDEEVAEMWKKFGL
jgi:predicted transcriptional regulator